MAEIKVYDPREFDKTDWRQLQTIARNGYAAVLPGRAQTEIDELVAWEDPERFAESHRDPNTEVGRQFNADQSFSHPRVAVATYLREAVGFAYSAHNVSGTTEQERHKKRLTIVKNYLWLREVAVAPWQQREGVAKQLGRRLLWHAIPIQPVSTYIWPDELPFLRDRLEAVGFQDTGESPVQIYGEGSEPVVQVRMQAATAFGVLHRLY